MPRHTVVLALGVCAAIIVAGAVLRAAVMESSGQAAAASAAAPVRFVNARVEMRSASTGLRAAVSQAATSLPSALWIGYTVQAVPGEHRMCESDMRPGRAYLEGRPPEAAEREARTAALEAPRDIAVLLRAEAGRVEKIRVFSPDCELDAGGLPVVWLTDVKAAESVALLRSMIGDVRPATSSERAADRREQAAVMAIALHADPAASRALDELAAPSQPLPLRKRAVFWLGAARGREGFDTLKRLATSDSDPALRREVMFALSVSHDPQATDELIRAARNDASPEVRKQAMFWLGTKAGSRAAGALTDAITNDPDTEVKKRAVFGLSRMPGGEGVPRLIEVARTNRNPAVRKQAMFWLGQSNDPRALDFLIEVLRK